MELGQFLTRDVLAMKATEFVGLDHHGLIPGVAVSTALTRGAAGATPMISSTVISTCCRAVIRPLGEVLFTILI